MDADDVQTVEQVLTETPLADQALQVLVGRGDDAYVHLDRFMPADPVELSVGQHPQQTGLQFRRHITDLVQKQGAAVRLFETSYAAPLGPGEGPLFVAEQLRFEQVMRYGRHVQCDERPIRARAVTMQGLRRQFLAGAGFTVDQHRDIGSRQAPDGPKRLLHRGRLTDDLGGFIGHTGLFHQAFAAQAARTLHLIDRFGHIERLGQVFEGAAVIGGDGTVQIGMGGHDDHRHIRVFRLDPLQQRNTVHPRHADVGHDGVGLLPRQCLEDAVGAAEGSDLDSGLFQGLFQHPANRPVIVYDPNRI